MVSAIVYVLPILWLFGVPPPRDPADGPIGYEEARTLHCKDCKADTTHWVESSVKTCSVCGKTSSL